MKMHFKCTNVSFIAHTHTRARARALLMSLLFDQFVDAPAQVQMIGVVDV